MRGEILYKLFALIIFILVLLFLVLFVDLLSLIPKWIVKVLELTRTFATVELASRVGDAQQYRVDERQVVVEMSGAWVAVTLGVEE